MDTLIQCSCLCAAFAGFSDEEVLAQAPCPPPFFYSNFTVYALNKCLNISQICTIAKRCISTAVTNNTHIIQSICFPTTPTIPTTSTATTTTTPSSRPTLSTSTSPSTTPSTTSTTTLPPTPHTTPVPPIVCSSVCIGITVALVLLCAIGVCIFTMFVWYKRNGGYQVGNWKSLFRNRRNTDRIKVLHTEKKETVCFDNPNYSSCIETIEIQESKKHATTSDKELSDIPVAIVESRLSKTEVDVHMKMKNKEVILDAVITDHNRTVNLVEMKSIEQDKQRETSGFNSKGKITVTVEETVLDEVAEIKKNRLNPRKTAIVHEEHIKIETDDNTVLNAHIRSSDEVKMNHNDCDDTDVTETILEDTETKTDKTSNTRTDMFDGKRIIITYGTTKEILVETRDTATNSQSMEVADGTKDHDTNGIATETLDETRGNGTNGTTTNIPDKTGDGVTNGTAMEISETNSETDAITNVVSD